MIGYILYIMIVAVISLYMTKRFQADSFITIPAAFCTTALTVYVMGMMDMLLIGVLAVIAGAICFGYLMVRNKNHYVFALYDVYPIMIFFLYAVIFYLLNRNRKVWAGDDLYHWGLVAKNMFYWDKLCTGEPVIIQYTHYPEISSIPGYIALKLNGIWDEGILFSAQALWGCVMLLPLLHRRCRKRNLLMDAAVCCVIFFLPLFYSSRYTAYNCLQVDRLLGFAFAFCMILMIQDFEDSVFEMIAVSAGLSVLASIKESGIYLGIMTVIFYMIHRFLSAKQISWKNIVAMAGASILPSVAWDVCLKIHGAEKFLANSAADFSLHAAASILNLDDVIRGEAFYSGVKRVLGLEKFRIGSNGSYLVWMLFLMAVFVTANLMKNKKMKTAELTVYPLLFLFFAFMWWCGVMYVILFKFTEEQIIVLSSFERYMDTFMIGMVFALLYYVFHEIEIKNNRSIFLAGAVVLCLFSFRNIGSNMKYILMDIPSTNAQRESIEQKIDDNVRKNLVKEKDRIYIISCDEDGARPADYYHCVFDLAPVPVKMDFSKNEPGWYRFSYLLAAEKENTEYEDHITYYSKNDFSDVLKGYTYLLILSSNKRFSESYKELFENGRIENGFYRIDPYGQNLLAKCR